jgi:hypothetical protein
MQVVLGKLMCKFRGVCGSLEMHIERMVTERSLVDIILILVR